MASAWGQMTAFSPDSSCSRPEQQTNKAPAMSKLWAGQRAFFGLRDSGVGLALHSQSPCTETRRHSCGVWVAVVCQQEAGGGTQLSLDRLSRWKKCPLCNAACCRHPGAQRGRPAGADGFQTLGAVGCWHTPNGTMGQLDSSSGCFCDCRVGGELENWTAEPGFGGVAFPALRGGRGGVSVCTEVSFPRTDL